VSNMNGTTRKKKYVELVKRDGEYCKGCCKLPHEGQLIVDHRDNNNSNNTLNNLQLLCRACNYVKNPRNRPLDSCVSTNDNFELRLSKFKIKEVDFEIYLYERIENSDDYCIDIDDAINSGAQKVDISVETAKRHLKKLISKEGPFKKYDPVKFPKAITKKVPPTIYYQW